MTLTERLRAAIQPSECLTSVVSNALLNEAANQIEHAVIPNMRIETMETETKFTPGPWRFNPTVEHAGTVSADALGLRVALICAPSMGQTNQTDANGRLIAASPLLFDALSELVEDYEDRFDMDSPSTNPGIRSAVKHGRAAIAAARGTKE